MAYLTTTDLKTHLYEEITNAIVDGDSSIIQDGIDTAMDEARGYLTKFDLDAEFNTIPAADRNKKLISVIKDIAAWEIICLANPNIEIDFRLQRYEFAVNWLKMVQAGKIAPNLPLPAPSTSSSTNGGAGGTNGTIKWDSNPKRRNQF